MKKREGVRRIKMKNTEPGVPFWVVILTCLCYSSCHAIPAANEHTDYEIEQLRKEVKIEIQRLEQNLQKR